MDEANKWGTEVINNKDHTFLVDLISKFVKSISFIVSSGSAMWEFMTYNNFLLTAFPCLADYVSFFIFLVLFLKYSCLLSNMGRLFASINSTLTLSLWAGPIGWCLLLTSWSLVYNPLLVLKMTWERGSQNALSDYFYDESGFSLISADWNFSLNLRTSAGWYDI